MPLWYDYRQQEFLSYLDYVGAINIISEFSSFLYKLLSLPYSFFLASCLNGNNGEWTNSDDLAHKPVGRIRGTSFNKDDARQDRFLNAERRVAAKHKEKIKGEARLEAAVIVPAPVVLPTNDGKMLEFKLSKEFDDYKTQNFREVFCVLSLYFSPNEDLTHFAYAPTINGFEVFRYDNHLDCFISDTGLRLPYVREGELINNVTSAGYGYVERSTIDIGRSVHAQGSINVYQQDDRRIGGRFFTFVDSYYYIPLFVMLWKSYPHTKPTEALHSQANAFARKTFPLLANHLDRDNRDLLLNTIDHFYIHSMVQGMKAIGSLDLASSIDGRVEIVGEIGLSDLINNAVAPGLLHDNKKPWKVQSTVCDVRPDWEWNVAILDGDPSCKGCTFTEQYGLRFNSQGEARSSWFITRLFALVGIGASFVQYSNSSRNAELAFKRILGCRPNEALYHDNQLHLFNNFVAKHEYNNNTWTKAYLGYADIRSDIRSLFSTIDEVKVDSFITQFPSSFSQKFLRFSTFEEFMYDCVEKLIECCSRSKIDHVLTDVNLLNWAYLNLYKAYYENLYSFDHRQAAAQIDHIKRKLRQTYVDNQLLHTQEDVMVKRMKSCIKNELAKFGKVPRFFVTYDAGCMYANYLPEFVKMCIDGQHVYNYGAFKLYLNIIAKPRDNFLDKLFQECIRARSDLNTLHVYIYSDDSVYSGNFHNKPFTYNVDISSCDSSNRELVFLTTYLAMGKFSYGDSKGLIQQCLKPLEVVNPFDNSEKAVFKLKHPFEGSGSVLTTILNHFASSLIAYSAFYKMCTLRMSPEDSIIQGAFFVGHLVTCETCDVNGDFVPERIQFLKHSPILCTDGIYRSTINLGCILRALGSVDNDLDAIKLGLTQVEFLNMTWTQRMLRFVGGVINGFVHEIDNPVIHALRERFVTDTSVFSESGEKALRHIGALRTTSVGVEIDLQSFLARYSASTEELAEFLTQVRHVQIGQTYASSFLNKVYKIDYGVEPRPRVDFFNE